MTFKLAFIGFGVVGQGLAEILAEKRERLREKYDFEFEVVAISDMKLGSVYDPEGLDLDEILKKVEEGDSLSDHPDAENGWDSLETIEKADADTIIEVTFTDMETGGPALDHVKKALKMGKNVVSTNKGPVAQEVKGLLDLADENDVHYKFEGTVLSGTPAINLAMKNLAGCEIEEIKGIVNGTTNYILTKMEDGMGYEEALQKAQDLGYAEADPTGDVEGVDAQGKTLILSNTVMGADMDLEDVDREGITGLTSQDIKEAEKEGKRWKLIAHAEKDGGEVKAKVSPEKLSKDHPLAGVMGPTNAITYSTDHLNDVTIIGPGAGKEETGYSLLVDLLAINEEV
ncbi:MAG: homoserine dehydrogenase [Candidatus Thermoplasmatota archaeon]|nr:homoserine dehydrogenase [Candidatus Thermoplasmatota archaeon]